VEVAQVEAARVVEAVFLMEEVPVEDLVIIATGPLVTTITLLVILIAIQADTIILEGITNHPMATATILQVIKGVV